MLLDIDTIIPFECRTEFHLPLYASYVPAGFPSPADDFLEKKLDLNEHLVRHPSSTFFVRAQGHSMVKAGIHDGDLLVVDRKLFPKDGSIIVASLHGELTVKRLRYGTDGIFLSPESDDYTPILITDTDHFVVWGVVTSAIHAFH